MRPLQRRELAPQHDEPRAGQPRGPGEVHAERARRAPRAATASKSKLRGLAPAPQLDVAALVGAVRHVVGQHVGEGRQQRVEPLPAARAKPPRPASRAPSVLAISASSSGAGFWPWPERWPISRDRRLRVAWSSCSRVSSSRRAASSSRIVAAAGGWPRRASARSNASGLLAQPVEVDHAPTPARSVGFTARPAAASSAASAAASAASFCGAAASRTSAPGRSRSRRAAACGIGEADLADHVGRRQDGGGDEDDHDGVAAPARELVGRDDADPAQQRQRHRQLEGDAEGEDQLHHQVEILADARLELDRQLARPADGRSRSSGRTARPAGR